MESKEAAFFFKTLRTQIICSKVSVIELFCQILLYFWFSLMVHTDSRAYIPWLCLNTFFCNSVFEGIKSPKWKGILMVGRGELVKCNELNSFL